jgi:serine/threonine protein kinase
MTQFERIGRFQVLDRIAGDAFSLLYSGHDPFEDRPVEIRVCVASDDEFRWRFLKAAEDSLFLRHRNIARVLEFGSGEPKPYLVQEVFPGCSLRERILSEEPVEDVVKLFYLLQIAQGLQYAHSQGVLHKQVSTEVVRVGEGERVKLCDFGVAQLASSWIQLQAGGAAYPSSGYILPEVLAGLAPNQRSEVFGFGAAAYETLTSRPPFPAASLPDLVYKLLHEEPVPLASLWPECPAELAEVIHKCLSLDPRRRYGGLEEVLDELSAVLPIPAEPADEISQVHQPASEDSQTVYILDPESLQGSEPGVESEPGSETLATGPVTPGFPLSWWLTVQSAVHRVMVALPSFAELKGKMEGLNWRWWPAAAALLLLFVVAGWGLANRGGSEPNPEPESPILTPTVPTAREAVGLLSLDAQPWAEVIRIVDETGDEVPLAAPGLTPLTLQLPEGQYRIVLAHPRAGEPQECRVQVSSHRKSDCRLQFARIETEDYFRLSGWWQ